MRYKIKLHNMIFIVFVYFISSSTSWAVEAEENIQFTSHLSKDTFFIGEPIFLRFSLVNNSGEEILAAEPLAFIGFVKIKVTYPNGESVTDPRSARDVKPPPPEYGIRLAKGMKMERYYCLNEDYHWGLQPGSYLLDCTYNTEIFQERLPKIWHGKREASKLSFTIVIPVGREKEAWTVFEKGRNLFLSHQRDKYNQARKHFSELLNSHPASVYAPYASYLSAKSHFVMQEDKTQHFAEAAKAFQDFSETYPDYPYYADMTKASHLPFCLIQTGKFDEAGRVIKGAPGGYYRDSTVRILKKHVPSFEIEKGDLGISKSTKPVPSWVWIITVVAVILFALILISILRNKARRGIGGGEARTIQT